MIYDYDKVIIMINLRKNLDYFFGHEEKNVDLTYWKLNPHCTVKLTYYVFELRGKPKLDDFFYLKTQNSQYRNIFTAKKIKIRR